VKTLVGFHAVTSRLRQKPDTIGEIYVDATRNDGRAKDLRKLAEGVGVRVIPVDAKRLDGMAGGTRHQGVVAQAQPLDMPQFIEDVLEALAEPPLLLILDGVQDPHNLGACLRVADGAGAHAVIAPKDRSVGLTSAAIKVASGAAESVPYIVVTNLARTMRDLKDRGIWLVGTADTATETLYQARLDGPVGLVLGAEGEGLRRLTQETCDLLVSIPMLGSVESLNVSVASGVCLYEARRRRLQGTVTSRPRGS
jgi:23S rRNA (guanosine2251-2'-O)-methyltransferase